jgi:hypothetical protein
MSRKSLRSNLHDRGDLRCQHRLGRGEILHPLSLAECAACDPLADKIDIRLVECCSA